MSTGFNVNTVRDFNRIYLYGYQASEKSDMQSRMASASVSSSKVDEGVAETPSDVTTDQGPKFSLAVSSQDSFNFNDTTSENTLSSESTEYFPTLVYSAYLVQDFGYEATMTLSSMFGSAALGKQGGTVRNVISTALSYFDLPTALDVERHYVFGGSNELSFDLHTVLYLKDSWESDIRDPFNMLINYVLPTSSDDKLEDILKSAKSSAGKLSDGKENLKQFYEFMGDALEKAISWVGDIYTLKAPLWMRGRNRLALQYGDIIRIDGIAVNSVGVSFPKLVYESDNGNWHYPPYLKVDLRCTTLRPSKFEMLKLR